jgi:tetratricopeptide (TPR) repeat protein
MAPAARPPRREPGKGPRRAAGPPAKRAGVKRDAPAKRGAPPKRDGAPKAAPKPPGSGGRGRGPTADSAKTAKWGGVARRGARNLDEPKPGTAAAAWRDAAAKSDRERAAKRTPRPADDRDEWIDAGPVREEASQAVARGAAPKRSRRRTVPDEVADEVARAAGPAWAGRVKDRLAEGAKAYEAERFRDARRILEPLLERAPGAVAVRELLGLTYYRMGKWRDAIRELGAVELLTGSVDHHPVIADCHRALGHLDEVERLWDELRRTGAGIDVVIEGRIVFAGALADRGRVVDAVKVLEQGPVDVRNPQEHHLRLWYALAAQYERAGDVPHARALFGRLVFVAPDFGDARERLESLGG